MASFGMAGSVVVAARKAMVVVINKALILIGQVDEQEHQVLLFFKAQFAVLEPALYQVTDLCFQHNFVAGDLLSHLQCPQFGYVQQRMDVKVVVRYQSLLQYALDKGVP